MRINEYPESLSNEKYLGGPNNKFKCIVLLMSPSIFSNIGTTTLRCPKELYVSVRMNFGGKLSMFELNSWLNLVTSKPTISSVLLISRRSDLPINDINLEVSSCDMAAITSLQVFSIRSVSLCDLQETN